MSNNFRFIPAYSDAIAEAANSWAHLEYYINSSIWSVAGMPPAIGACVTSQIFTVAGRLSALVALLRLRRVDTAIIDEVNKFSETSRSAQSARNRIVHDLWLTVNDDPTQMGKMQITADKKLQFTVAALSIEDVQADVEKIHASRKKFSEIRERIRAALPTLPEIPQSELHPIEENPRRQQTPSNGDR